MKNPARSEDKTIKAGLPNRAALAIPNIYPNEVIHPSDMISAFSSFPRSRTQACQVSSLLKFNSPYLPLIVVGESSRRKLFEKQYKSLSVPCWAVQYETVGDTAASSSIP